VVQKFDYQKVDKKIDFDDKIILGIETSCDETAAAVVTGRGEILADVVLSQIEEHRPYGGVVPEIAARSHIEHLDRLIAEALDKAGITVRDLDAVAATAGPGLIGGVLVGLMTGKAMAQALKLPFLAVNHLEGHALSARLTGQGVARVAFPYLLLLASGGHCQLLVVKGVGNYQRLGTTIDDAAGEAFDKTAKMLGLGYPGGPAVEKAALLGDAVRFAFPRPMKGRAGADFSFSGLKTAVLREAEKLGPGITMQDKADLAASFQAALTDAIIDRVKNAMSAFRGAAASGSLTFVVAGGVAANRYLRTALEALCADQGFSLFAPPLSLCTDNAAMIAWAGAERLRLGLVDDLATPARARWPLDPNAPLATGAGIKA
jgi:N6-L-threonylcarbamoyladenine synthase